MKLIKLVTAGLKLSLEVLRGRFSYKLDITKVV